MIFVRLGKIIPIPDFIFVESKDLIEIFGFENSLGFERVPINNIQTISMFNLFNGFLLAVCSLKKSILFTVFQNH